MIIIKVLKNNQGQSLVEFAIILPILLLVLMGIVEFGLMLNSYLTVRNVSREGARAAVIGSSDIEINDLSLNISPTLNNSNLKVNITPSEVSRKSGEPLTVEIEYNHPVTVPIISNLFRNNIVLKAQTTMRIE